MRPLVLHHVRGHDRREAISVASGKHEEFMMVRAPWMDRHGRFLPLKAVVVALGLGPGAIYGYWWATGELGGRAVNDVIHATGLWAIRFLLVTLAITPFARLLHWNRLLSVRRIIGVTAASYATIHLLLYVVEQKYAPLLVLSEIISRFYLTIGFVALVGLIALTVTSTDASVRRMGRAWKRLHWLVYPITVLALWHYALQSKANVSEAVFAAGLFVWLLLWRGLPEVWRRPIVVYPAMAVIASLLTAAIEFGWYGLASGVDPWRVLEANQSIEFGLRPAHLVLVVSLGVAAVISLRRLIPSKRAVLVNAV